MIGTMSWFYLEWSIDCIVGHSCVGNCLPHQVCHPLEDTLILYLSNRSKDFAATLVHYVAAMTKEKHQSKNLNILSRLLVLKSWWDHQRQLLMWLFQTLVHPANFSFLIFALGLKSKPSTSFAMYAHCWSFAECSWVIVFLHLPKS
jgi:hypothetical protein